jgi:PhzF family phenazine biosynthesis protein
MRRRFQQVDVFSAEPYRGNPVAVILDGDGLADRDLQGIARWTNLSETTFVLPPTADGADYRVRIFTPAGELPFAGHPTLGTCHAWLTAGGSPAGPDVVVQECPAGLVTLRRQGSRLAFAAPPLVRSGPAEEPLIERIAEVLRVPRDLIVDAQWVDNGLGWVAVLLPDADAVLTLEPGPIGDLDIGVVGLLPPGSDGAVEVRAFFTANGVTVEDPVTGSLNASLAGWLARTGQVQLPYVARQGTVLGRTGRVHLDGDPHGTIWVAGDTVTCIEGHLSA